MKKLSKNDIKGIIATFAFHALLLICFLFLFGFKTPLPLPQEEGIEIDLGGGGGGSSAPVEITKPVPNNNNYATQNSEDAVSLNNNKTNKVTTEVKEVKEQVIDPKFIYKPGNNSKAGNGNGNGNGNGDGSGTGPGKGTGQGDGDGSGIGHDSGPSFSLNGRKARSLPTPKITNAQGKVVVRIKVDREGNVVDAEAISRGTTIANSQVWRVCEDFALKSKFDAKPDAAEIQMGTITYIII